MIPLFKVRMSPEAAPAVAQVLSSGHIAQGEQVDLFEQELAPILEVEAERIVTVNSGTSALHLAYHVAGVGRTSLVHVPPMTCAATITPLVHLGTHVRWIDVNRETGNVEPQNGWGTQMVVVDWAGRPAPVEEIRQYVPHQIPIIEDAAHAFGARRRDGRMIATTAADHNLFVCFSLQAIKHLTTGDGGILVCPTQESADRARKLRWFGFDRRSSKDFRCAQDLEEAGHKFHMNDVAAAIGRANLPLVSETLRRHRDHAYVYTRTLGDLAPKVQIPPWDEGSSWWLYTLLVDDRDSFQQFMGARGIQTSQVHRRNDEHSAFSSFKHENDSLPGLDHFASHQVSIPVGWWLTASEVQYIIDAVKEWATL